METQRKSTTTLYYTVCCTTCCPSSPRQIELVELVLQSSGGQPVVSHWSVWCGVDLPPPDVSICVTEESSSPHSSSHVMRQTCSSRGISCHYMRLHGGTRSIRNNYGGFMIEHPK